MRKQIVNFIVFEKISPKMLQNRIIIKNIYLSRTPLGSVNLKSVLLLSCSRCWEKLQTFYVLASLHYSLWNASKIWLVSASVETVQAFHIPLWWLKYLCIMRLKGGKKSQFAIYKLGFFFRLFWNCYSKSRVLITRYI